MMYSNEKEPKKRMVRQGVLRSGGWVLSNGRGSVLAKGGPLGYKMVPLFDEATVKEGFILERTRRALKDYERVWRLAIRGMPTNTRKEFKVFPARMHLFLDDGEPCEEYYV